jgi:hypothetical protein
MNVQSKDISVEGENKKKKTLDFKASSNKEDDSIVGRVLRFAVSPRACL